MENPFKQFIPESAPPKEVVEEKVMGSIRLKSYFANLLEFFMAIFGGFIDEAPEQEQAKTQK